LRVTPFLLGEDSIALPSTVLATLTAISPTRTRKYASRALHAAGIGDAISRVRRPLPGSSVDARTCSVNVFIKDRRRARRQEAASEALPVSRREAKEATRARVLEAAKAQLESVGFDETNIRGVAKAAGVATGTVLLHFADKRQLLHAAMFEDLERTWLAAREKSGDRSLRDELATLVKAFFEYYARRPALSRTLLRESLFAEPPWSTRFAAQVGEVHQHVVMLTEKAKARGELDGGVDSNVLGASFFSFYYFALLAWLQGGHEEPQRLFERMLDQHLEHRLGLRSPREKKTKGNPR
jgi:AcrR family transcriptional regulator